jgi:hypothetical protein
MRWILTTLTCVAAAVVSAPLSTPLSAQYPDARCTGDPAIVRVVQIRPTSSYEAFLRAQEAQVAWYQKNGFADLQVYSSRVSALDPQTHLMKDSDTVIAFHVRPPDVGQSVAAKDQAGWDAYVQQYRDSSEIKAQYTVCLPKNR